MEWEPQQKRQLCALYTSRCLSLCRSSNDCSTQDCIIFAEAVTRCPCADYVTIAIHFLTNISATIYQLNSSSIVYTWTYENEIYYSNIKKFKVNFSMENNGVNSMEPFYPLYLGESIEFTPRRHSSSMTRPVENGSNLQLIPSEIEVNNQ